MLAGHSHRLLEEASRPSLERIQLDRRKVPQRIKPLLAYIEDNLFDPTLDVNQLKRCCGVRDNSVPIQFHSAVGRPPHGYIEDRRLETACRLLAETHLKIWQISELLGYSSIQVFSRAFSRWAGERPTLFRKKARRDRGRAAGVSASAREGKQREHSVFPTDALRKALDGDLPYEEAKSLMGRLEELYPRQDGGDGEPSESADDPGRNGAQAPVADERSLEEIESARLAGNARDRYQAEILWSQLNGQAPARQQEILERETLTSAALFHCLIEKSRDVGRNEPDAGVHIAELAILSLEALARRRGDEKQFADLQAQGWMRLANARALAADLQGAEDGFEQAERLLEAGGRRPATAAELLALKASLRRDQRRFHEARELLDRARAICPQEEEDELMAKILLAQASVRFEEGNPAAAIPFLEQALPLVDRIQNAMLKLAVYHNLVATYSEAGLFEKAVKLLSTARSLSLEHGTAFNKIRFRWLEGLVSRGLGELDKAEGALVEAREAFSDLGDSFSTALVCLDLADLFSKQNRSEHLAELCACLAPLSGMLQQHPEASVAVQLLQSAAEEHKVTSVVVERARQALLRSQKQAVYG